VRLALLKGNRFNAWHLELYRHLRGDPDVVMFRAESEIQRYLDEQDGGAPPFAEERIYFDTQCGNPATRLMNVLRARYAGREARIVPFHERLQAYDIIHTWELFTDWSAEAAVARQRYGIPLAVMVWDNIPFNMEHPDYRREIKRRVIAAADCFLVHTDRSLRTLAVEGVPTNRIHKFPPGIDTGLFCPGQASRGAFGVSDEEFVILFVGWLLPRKGIDFLLLALRELLSDSALATHKLRLLMAGSGPGKDRVEQLIARLGLKDACTFLGSVPYDRMPEVYRCADAFVLPSIATPEWQEQFGMAIIEAMSCGVPVVTTYSGAIPEIVGDAAVLCQPNDFLSIYAALKDLIQEPSRRADLAAAGRARAMGCFDVRRAAQTLSDIYDSLLGKRNESQLDAEDAEIRPQHPG